MWWDGGMQNRKVMQNIFLRKWSFDFKDTYRRLLNMQKIPKFSRWEKTKFLLSIYIQHEHFFNIKMRETKPATSHVKTLIRVLTELSSQGLNFEEEIKALALLSSLPMSWEVFYTIVTRSLTKQSEWYCRKSFKESRLDLPGAMTLLKLTYPREWLKELTMIKAGREGEMTDNGRSWERADQANSAHTAEKLGTMFPNAGGSRGKRVVGDPSEIEDDPTQTTLQLATKSTLLTLDQEKFSP